jgi:hypothetical protein
MTGRTPLRVLVESTPKKIFASALDWPGFARSGRDEQAAIAALLVAAPRYAPVAMAAGEAFDPDHLDVDVVERADGDATTAFGAPSIIAQADRTPVSATDAERLAAIVEAAWAAFDHLADAAPEALRKGPRGGGRDTSKVTEHVNGADAGYATVLGLKHRPDDRAAVLAMRAAVLATLRRPSDGSPIAGRKWPPRYAARRIAWHALDHAWEIEDRSTAG